MSPTAALSPTTIRSAMLCSVGDRTDRPGEVTLTGSGDSAMAHFDGPMQTGGTTVKRRQTAMKTTLIGSALLALAAGARAEQDAGSPDHVYFGACVRLGGAMLGDEAAPTVLALPPDVVIGGPGTRQLVSWGVAVRSTVPVAAFERDAYAVVGRLEAGAWAPLDRPPSMFDTPRSELRGGAEMEGLFDPSAPGCFSLAQRAGPALPVDEVCVRVTMLAEIVDDPPDDTDCEATVGGAFDAGPGTDDYDPANPMPRDASAAPEADDEPLDGDCAAAPGARGGYGLALLLAVGALCRRRRRAHAIDAITRRAR